MLQKEMHVNEEKLLKFAMRKSLIEETKYGPNKNGKGVGAASVADQQWLRNFVKDQGNVHEKDKNQLLNTQDSQSRTQTSFTKIHSVSIIAAVRLHHPYNHITI